MSSPRLEESVAPGKSPEKLAMYFGCWQRAGHYLHYPNGSTSWSKNRPYDLPWNETMMDTSLLKNGNIPDVPDGKVYWTCGGEKAFWFAFFWWDRSVDTRRASNSGFYVRGFSHPEVKEAFDYACSQFPQVVARQKFPLALQVNWRQKPNETT